MNVFSPKHEHPAFFRRLVLREEMIYIVLYCPTCQKRFVEQVKEVRDG